MDGGSYRYQIVAALFAEKIKLYILNCLCIFVKNQWTVCVDLLLGSLFCSTDVYVIPFANTNCLDSCGFLNLEINY